MQLTEWHASGVDCLSAPQNGWIVSPPDILGRLLVRPTKWLDCQSAPHTGSIVSPPHIMGGLLVRLVQGIVVSRHLSIHNNCLLQALARNALNQVPDLLCRD
jgi:hypothetical protein